MPRHILAVTLLLFVACQPDAVQNPGSNRPPLAVIVPVPAREEGALISLDGTRSSDPDDDSLSYAWSFGDGGGAPGAMPAHAFQDDGTYTVTLVVKDRAGAADTATTQVVITNAPPVITSLFAPAEQRIDSAAKISVAVRDPGSADTYDLIVGWGDGARDTIPGAKEATHKYERPGSYHVQVTARDDDGAEGSRSAASPIDVFDPTVNRRPVATVSGPSETREGAIVQFSAIGSMDPDGDPLTFIWLSGDGNTWSGNGVRSGWVYKDNGTFTVSVIVRDGRGGADTATTVVVVHNTPPASLVVTQPLQQAPGLLLNTYVSFSDSGLTDTHLLTVDWGNGERDSVTIEADQRFERFIPVAHAYAVSGTYSVRATVRDKDGASATAGHVVEVIDPSRRRTIAGYEVVDLGTLGGNSAVPGDFNDYGMVVGSSLTTSGRTHAFLWNDGDMRDLGTLGQDNSGAERINNAGVIAGTVWPATPYEGCRPNTIAAIWRNGSGTLLDSRGAIGMPVKATAMNESGDVAWSACGQEHDYAWVSRGSSWQRLGALRDPENPSYVGAMNELGEIVGGSPAVANPGAPGGIGHGTVWQDGALRDLGVLSFVPCWSEPNRNCAYSTATDINESGQIVGVATSTDNLYHAVLWSNGTIRDLWEAPAAQNGLIEKIVINDRGQVSGSVNGEGFFWSEGSLRSLGSLGGGSTQVVDMNEAGTVVGTSMTSNGEQHAFVWRAADGMVDLGTGPHGFNGAWVVGISYFGDIVGYTAPCIQLDPVNRCWVPPPGDVRAVLWRNTTGKR